MTTFLVANDGVLHTTDKCCEFAAPSIGSVQRPGSMVVCADCEPEGVHWDDPAWGAPGSNVHIATGAGIDAEEADE